MSRSTAPYGMVLDRGLTLEQLDLALRSRAPTRTLRPTGAPSRSGCAT